VELDDLGVVSDDGNRPAEWRDSDLGAGEVDVLPRHRVELGLAVVAVVEELPLRGDGDIGHGGGGWKSAMQLLRLWFGM